MSPEPMYPTAPSERIESIDVLRGIVVLGILTINIMVFGLPFAVTSNPTLWGTYEGPDVIAYVVAHIGFQGAQRGIFSMLFGAGVILFIQRIASDERQSKMGRLYYRRMFGLMLFGLFDMFLLLWFGDIIFLYGLVGLLLYVFRDSKPQGLLIGAGVLFVLLTLMFAFAEDVQLDNEARLQEVQTRADENSEQRSSEHISKTVNAMGGYFPFQEEMAAKQQGYFSAYPYVVDSILELQVKVTIGYSFWEVLFAMLLGMALFRLGVFDASRSIHTYVIMLVLGFSIGIIVNTYEVMTTLSTDYSESSMYLWSYNLGRMAMAFGYIGTVMLVCKLGLLPRVRSCLAAVGKMALTNYLMQSILCLAFFILLGFYGKLRFHELYYVVLVIWILQLIYSPLWLARYRYGPAEYLWRRWTYGSKIQNRRLSAD
ncbi:MAG: DUF418 domain-containing protein [Gammaproteobacteria bacterium]|nr:DUF418 domain-containing protein [Gammaproteobacteria bacterium]